MNIYHLRLVRTYRSVTYMLQLDSQYDMHTLSDPIKWHPHFVIVTSSRFNLLRVLVVCYHVIIYDSTRYK